MLAQVACHDSYPGAAAPVIELHQWLLSAWDARDAKAYVALVREKGTDANQSLTAQRDAGRWQIANFQDPPTAFHGRPE